MPFTATATGNVTSIGVTVAVVPQRSTPVALISVWPCNSPVEPVTCTTSPRLTLFALFASNTNTPSDVARIEVRIRILQIESAKRGRRALVVAHHDTANRDHLIGKGARFAGALYCVDRHESCRAAERRRQFTVLAEAGDDKQQGNADHAPDYAVNVRLSVFGVAVWRGKVTTNRVVPVESTAIVPPCVLTICSTI
jgi:hypothetical protein